MADFVDWRALEEAIPLDELPSFHRAFLALARPDEDYADAPLRQVQGKVQASLKALARADRARVQGDRVWVDKAFIPEVFAEYSRKVSGG